MTRVLHSTLSARVGAALHQVKLAAPDLPRRGIIGTVGKVVRAQPANSNC